MYLIDIPFPKQRGAHLAFPSREACRLRRQQGDLLGPDPGEAKESRQCASGTRKEGKGEREGEA